MSRLRRKKLAESNACRYISFADPTVKSLCVTNFDSTGNGKVSKREAAAADIQDVFTKNTEIETFDEFKYFTSILRIVNDHEHRANFVECTNLKSIKLPKSIVQISGYAGYTGFWDTKLTEIEFPADIQIWNDPFRGCSLLKTLIFHGKLDNSNGSFSKLAIEKIFIPSIESWCATNGNGDGTCSPSGGGVASLYLIGSETPITDVVIPSSVTSIGAGTFFKIQNINTITFADSVTSIGGCAFYECQGTMELPKNAVSIGEYAFFGCKNLTIGFGLADNVTIGDYAFAGCINLDTIYRGTTLVHANGSVTSFSVQGAGYTIASAAFYGNTSITTCDLNNPISIGAGCFQGCTSLTSVTNLGTITSIPKNVFNGCTNLTSIDIPDGVTTIGVDAFKNCSSLTSITLPSSLTSLDRVFQGCSGIEELVVPEGCTAITFENDWTGPFADAGFKKIILPSTITSITNMAFRCLPNLEYVVLKATSVPSGGTPGFWNSKSKNIYVPDESYEAYTTAYADGISSNLISVYKMSDLPTD